VIAAANVFGLPEWADRLAVIGLVAALALALLAVVRWIVPRALRGVSRAEDPARARQRRAAVGVLASSLRYVIALSAILAIFIVLIGGGGLAALGSAALIVALIGFASQRFLIDIIAGFFILFDGEFRVGDLVRLDPPGYMGVVEDFNLRRTHLRDLNGDVLSLPNGSITGVRRVRGGWRTFMLQLTTRDPVSLVAALSDIVRLAPVGEGRLFLRAPQVLDSRSLGDGLTRLRVRVDASPSAEWVIQDFLLDSLRAKAGDFLAGDPSVESIGQASLPRARAPLTLD
jgi:small-conductance mechanosensitive channel